MIADGAVAARAPGGVEGIVRRTQELRGRAGARARRREPDRDRDRHGHVGELVAHGRPQALGDGEGGDAAGVAQHDGELGAVEARRHVGAARRALQHGGEPAQDVVARPGPEDVVHVAEVVEVADQHRDGPARGDVLGDPRLEVALVAQAGNGVVRREVAEVLELPGRLDRADRLVGERAQRLQALRGGEQAVLGLVDPDHPRERAVAVVQRDEEPVVAPRQGAAAVALPAVQAVELGRGEQLGLLAGEQHAALALVLGA